MREFSLEDREIISRMAQARREARDHGPRVSNDDLEAAMLYAMMKQYDGLTTIETVQYTDPALPAPTPNNVGADAGTEEAELPELVTPSATPLLPPVSYAMDFKEDESEGKDDLSG